MNREPPKRTESGVDHQLQIDAECVRFEQQLRAGEQPRIEHYVAAQPEPVRSHLLRHLLQIELEFRAGRNEPSSIQDYLDRFPHYASLIHVVHGDHARGSYLGKTEAHGTAPSAAGSSILSTSDSSLHGRFVPGSKIAGRYRIVSLLGKGGMGEVYRADDLRLGQTVALKFLPKKLARDSNRQDRFQAEVRLTRQISHPNVCRVYDIDDVDGNQFLSMEFIDGEDLRVLLRRIGKLPQDKGVQIAQQLCAGLAAAHEKGVLHRDLKPANIMIDGRGQVRITDFGLAKLVDDQADGEVAGTPAYMAPEQLREGQATIQSDLYALGLILHEVFTGEAVNQSANAAELLQRQQDSSSNVSSASGDIDPVVQRAIERCLSIEPHQRPESARALAASLPGGDPLAAALAAGETPSPEMVAAAGSVGRLDPRVGGAMMAATVIAMIAFWIISSKTNPINLAGLNKEPAALAEDARDIIERFGYETPEYVDSAWGLTRDWDAERLISQRVEDTNASQLSSQQPPRVTFWYRRSPIPLQNKKFFGSDLGVNLGQIGPRDPPLTAPGMINVRLDPEGRLIEFVALQPTHHDPITNTDLQIDWTNALVNDSEEILGFSLDSFTEVPAQWAFPVAFDSRVAWKGEYANGTPIRVEAASFRGKPVSIRVIGAWTSADDRKSQYGRVYLAINMMLALVSVFLAAYNLKQGRGDRKGAGRLATLVFVCGLVIFLLRAHHQPSIDEFPLFRMAVSDALCVAALVWFQYIAFEPFVRRYWPDCLTAWSRALSGRLHDPLVGQHVMVGILFGTAAACLPAIWRGNSTGDVIENNLAPKVLSALSFSVAGSVMVVTLLMLFMMLFRSNLMAVLGCAGFGVLLATQGAEASLTTTVSAALVFAIDAFVVMRFGLLSIMALVFVYTFLMQSTMTTDPSSWYFESSIYTAAVVMAIAAYAFYVSLGIKSEKSAA